MKASCRSRIAMILAIFKWSFESNEKVQKCLAEGTFWLLDTIEDENREKNPQNRDCNIANISEIRRIAEKAFKDPAHWVVPKEGSEDCFLTACHRAMIGLGLSID